MGHPARFFTVRILSALIIALAFLPSARAQDEPAAYLHGSFENQFTGMLLRLYNGGWRTTLYDYTRLRVDLDAELPAEIQFRSNVVGRLFVGETEIYTVNLIPRRTVDALIARDPRWEMVLQEKYRLKNELYIDNAYVKIPVKEALITVGKQPLEQGAGYAWNPTDVFTDKDLMDPTYEKPGVIALRVMVPLGELASVELTAAPTDRLEHWAWGGRASLRLGSLSLSGASFVTTVDETDLAGSMDNMAAAVAAGQDPEQAILRATAQRILLGGDAVLDLAGIRFWAEGAYNFVEDDRGAPADWWELVGGLEYFFTTETHVMAEYFHYGRGPKQHGQLYDFNDWMSVLAKEQIMLGRDFLLMAIDQPFFDFWTVGFTAIQSLSDQSVALMADLRWDFIQDGELWLLASASAGDAEDFFSATKGQAWLRLKLYF